MAVIEYFVFFGILLLGIIFSFKIKKSPAVYSEVQVQRLKCESPIETRLYNSLVFNGYYVQTQVKCGPYRIDITIPGLNLAIECDGKEFHSSPEQKLHDRKKDAYLRKHGWKVIRFTGRQINRDMPKILTRIGNMSK
ncbi:endonuclease domain-containing protein [Heyndrickxia acidicola]|uniref:DUF559 domain-containing protein n=1 Tax=Heyndrickxia acidicola TaxID=209389 RepID=A0ABU6MDR2_9BACI|nr:DUF559 domain-containing protein [Heyndrickxia acidicola]MED1202552.1 DUF559 domain-containing protein [Heyndrickxia acidicola]